MRRILQPKKPQDGKEQKGGMKSGENGTPDTLQKDTH